MVKAYKYRIYPNTEQKIFFAKCFGCVRFFYNKSLDDMKRIYDESKTFKDITPASYKKDYPFLKEVDSLALANAQLNRNRAYKSFFRGQNAFPKYKSKRNNQTYQTNNQKGSVSISEDNKYITLPKVKNIRIKMHRLFKGTIKTVTVERTCSNQYYVSLLVEQEDSIKMPINNNSVGIDLGLMSFIVDSSNDRINNPRHLNKHLDKLKREQRKLSHMKKGSNNYRKQRIKLSRIHQHITNKRNDFLHKLSFKYISENQTIILEDLKTKLLLEKKEYSKSISDASWSRFISLLKYKAEWYGRTFVQVPTFFPSSQLCSVCGYQNKDIKDEHIREWECPICHSHHDRDYNASLNILNEGLKLLKART